MDRITERYNSCNVACSAHTRQLRDDCKTDSTELSSGVGQHFRIYVPDMLARFAGLSSHLHPRDQPDAAEAQVRGADQAEVQLQLAVTC